MIHERPNQQFKYFTFISMFYCTLLIASTLLPYKIINFFGFSEPGGIFIFPLTYLLGGAVAEAYGRDLALRMIYSSVFCLSAFTAIIAIIVRMPSVETAPHQEVFIQAFGHGIRLVGGCLIGLLFSDLTNIYKITRLKFFFQGKYFVQRCLWSTAISEIVFNIITYIITYFGVIPIKGILGLIISSWILKMVYSLIMIFPLLFLMNYLKRKEGINIYDTNKINYKFDPELLFFKFLPLSSVQNKRCLNS